MWRTCVNKNLPIILLIAIIWSGLFVSIEFNALKKDRYLKFESEYHVSQTMGLNKEEHSQLVTDLINYFHNNNVDLHRWFNDKEVSHMEDVLTLYQFLKVGAIISFCVLVFLISYWIKNPQYYQMFWQNYKLAVMILLTGLILLVFSCLINFEVMWHLFHKIFFRNDLWLLDPSRDKLIMLVPLQFFIKLVIDVGLVLMAWLSFFTFVIWRYRK